MSEETIKKKIRTAFSKLTDLTKHEKSNLNKTYTEIRINEFDDSLINYLNQEIKESKGAKKELFEAFLELAYHYRSQMYGGDKRKSRKTNRKPLRKRKNTLTKRRYRK